MNTMKPRDKLYDEWTQTKSRLAALWTWRWSSDSLVAWVMLVRPPSTCRQAAEQRLVTNFIMLRLTYWHFNDDIRNWMVGDLGRCDRSRLPAWQDGVGPSRKRQVWGTGHDRYVAHDSLQQSGLPRLRERSFWNHQKSQKKSRQPGPLPFVLGRKKC